MTPQTEQMVTLVLQMLASGLVTKGVISSDQASSLVTLLMTLGGAALGLGTLVYGIWRNRDVAVIQKAASLDGVVAIQTRSNLLANQADHPKVVHALPNS